MSNNDEKIPEPTPEEIAEAKKEAFLAEPDRFIDRSFIVACSVLDPKTKKIITMVNQNAPHLDICIAKTDLDFFITNEIARRYVANNNKKFTPHVGDNGGKAKGKFGKKRF